jgi:CubicO group peptidase (beta-lactamase class C family)
MSRTLLLVLVALHVLFVPVPAHADEVDQYVEAEMARKNIPGLSLAVVRDGRIVKAKGYGLANVELKSPATPETVYPLASVTKQFTATAIMLLVEDGRVGLDDRVGKYVEGVPEGWSAVTIRHLLTHTSGIKDYINELHLQSGCDDVTPQQIFEAASKAPLNFAPGERFAYSNTVYVALGMIIQKLTGAPFDAFLRERVFTPLGMTRTRRRSLVDLIPDRADTYDFRDGKLRHAIHLNPTMWDNPDGGLVSTVADLATWDGALSTERILKRSSLELMWSPAKLDDGDTAPYGFGWQLWNLRGHRFVCHAGGRPGVSAFTVRYVDDGLTVVALCNVGGTWLGPLAWTVAGIYNSDLVPPHMLKERADPSPNATRELLAFLSDIATGAPESARMTAAMRKAAARDLEGRRYTAARLQGMKSFSFLTCDDVRGRAVVRHGERVARICHYKMLTGDETRYYVFWLSDDGRAADYTSYSL